MHRVCSRRSLVLGLGVVLTATVLAGCSKAVEIDPPVGLTCPARSGPISFAYGARANSPAPSLPQPVWSITQQAAFDRQLISVFRVDGSPSRVLKASFTSTAKNDNALRNDFDSFMSQLQTALHQVRSETEQADTLAALTLAARAAPGGTVVLYDSGLQTTSPLDFRVGDLLDATPKDVVDFLTKEKLMPDLTGRTVILVGLGNTVPPQPPLDTHLHNNVIDIWRAISEAAGAACVDVLDVDAARAAVAENLPKVGVVPTPAEPTWVSCGQTILYNNGWVGFKPDQAVLVNPKAARQALGDLAKIMIAGNQRAELIGTTATDGTREGRLALSRERAEVIKNELVSLGVPADRITTRGVGNEWPQRVPDIGPHGELLPGPAAQNRSVVVQLTCPR